MLKQALDFIDYLKEPDYYLRSIKLEYSYNDFGDKVIFTCKSVIRNFGDAVTMIEFNRYGSITVMLYGLLKANNTSKLTVFESINKYNIDNKLIKLTELSGTISVSADMIMYDNSTPNEVVTLLENVHHFAETKYYPLASTLGLKI